MDKLDFTNARVRIAPSPTGLVHIGNLRTILYNYLFAKRYNSTFIIRIEDTDRSRYVPGALENLLKVLHWAGIENDEGPYLTRDDKVKEKGDFGPYIQSNRLDIYKEYIKTLLEKNKAYYCFCAKERLEKLRADQTEEKQAPKYDGLCRNLTSDEVKALLKKGEPYVIRFKMPENKKVIVKDLIRGDIVVNTKDLDDYVLMKSDGFPTYHFASIVDDHLMKITHVMRGDEWIASTPKHVLLYEAFGWQAPVFAHLPQLLNKNKKKLSKRDGATNVQQFIDLGYLKDALINFIALLGWNAGTEQEIYSLSELCHQFTLDNVHKNGAIFDIEKLNWINGEYLRKLSNDEFYDYCLPYLIKNNLLTQDKDKIIINATGEKVGASYIKNILSLEKTRIKKLAEISSAVNYFFSDKLTYDANMLVWKKSDKGKTLQNLTLLRESLGKLDENDFCIEKLEKHIQNFIMENSLDNGSVLWPMRFALSGVEKSPGPYELAFALGKEKTIKRLSEAAEKISYK